MLLISWRTAMAGIEAQRKDRIAELEELGSFDYAMPQDWFEKCYSATGENPSGHIVWFYPNKSLCYLLMGVPVAVTSWGDIILGRMATAP